MVKKASATFDQLNKILYHNT